MVDSYKVKRIYLDELGDLENQPLGIGLMLLTTTPESKAIEAAKFLLRKTKNTEVDIFIFEQEAIIDLVTKIIAYKFKFSREEIEAMLIPTEEQVIGFTVDLSLQFQTKINYTKNMTSTSLKI